MISILFLCWSACLPAYGTSMPYQRDPSCMAILMVGDCHVLELNLAAFDAIKDHKVNSFITAPARDHGCRNVL